MPTSWAVSAGADYGTWAQSVRSGQSILELQRFPRSFRAPRTGTLRSACAWICVMR
jgi:hypothetical protein